MDQIIKQVMEKTGLSDALAKQAVDTVFAYIQQNIPKPIADHVMAVLSNSAGGQAASGINAVIGGLGNMFGKK